MQMAMNLQTGCTKCLLEKLKGNDNFGDLDKKETGCDDSNESVSSIIAENFLNSCVTSSF
jgi:hypothetical protein